MQASQSAQASYQRFSTTGICDCGEHYENHVDHLDDLKRADTIKCKLTKDTIVAWHTPRFAGAPG